MSHRMGRTGGLVALTVCVLSAAAGAADLKTVAKELFAVPSTTGNEGPLAAKIRGLLPKDLAVEADGLGTIAVRAGGPAGPTLILAALDGYGHMVSGITPEGYLTLDRPVAPPHARYDAFLLGQPVIISTARGPIQGVVSQPAMHLLTPERRKVLVEGFTLETAYVDIGVRSEKEARAKGVELLDAVTYPAVWTELAGDRWAGPGLGLKAAAAGLVAAASALSGRSDAEGAVVCWAAQTKFAARGRGARPSVGAARAKMRWQPARTIVVDVVAADKGEGSPATGGGPVLIVAKDGPSALRQAVEAAAAAAGTSLQVLTAPDSSLTLPFAAAPAEVVTLALPVRFLNTPSEVVAAKDLQALQRVLDRFLRPGGAK
jgi:putative aminopeptidase FrvX